jgi:large subunit ribosomal protein L28
MARVCDICGKKTTVGCNVSHSHNISKKKVYPNLQKVNALIEGQAVRIKVCTTCIKSGKVIKPARKVLVN